MAPAKKKLKIVKANSELNDESSKEVKTNSNCDLYYFLRAFEC